MADFPRWVPHHGLDSIAALSAYLRWKSEQTIDWQLTCIQHRDPPHSLSSTGSEGGDSGRGGYSMSKPGMSSLRPTRRVHL